VAGFYVSLLIRSPEEDKKPMAALLAIFGVVIIFWAIFKQNGTALTTWAESYTDREVTGSARSAAEAIKAVQVVEFKKDTIPLMDEQFRTSKDAAGDIVKTYDYPAYYKNYDSRLLPPPDNKVTLISTELFQSINPFFVVLLTPLVVGFFAFLRKRNAEPGTPAKIFWGLFITALSTLLMIAATYACHNGLEKASAWWLIGTYGVITVGELCLSPMGLSLVSKLSPPRITALMMGGWFLSTSIGNKLSGVLAAMWDGYEHKSNFFIVNCLVALAAALMILFMLKWLSRIVKEHGG
jgi:POT family proton-dependent oligopeptide transporter